jgi:hypothetical protein
VRDIIHGERGVRACVGGLRVLTQWGLGIKSAVGLRGGACETDKIPAIQTLAIRNSIKFGEIDLLQDRCRYMLVYNRSHNQPFIGLHFRSEV